jgi:hypothetical protein
VTGVVVKLCHKCTQRARAAKDAAIANAAAPAQSSTASTSAAAVTSNTAAAADVARKRDRGMRYLETIFVGVDRSVLLAALGERGRFRRVRVCY